MTSPENEDLQRRICDAVDLDLKHVNDDETRDYDAVESDGTEVEIKTCQKFINGNGSRSNRRRGRFWIEKRQHERLVDVDGKYLLVVLDENQIIERAAVTEAYVADAEISDRWTTNGKGGHGTHSAQLPWGMIDDKVVDFVGGLRP